SATDHNGASQEVIARSPTMTWQAPHSPAPQPKCGPVTPSLPRKISSNGRSGSASTSVGAPLRRKRTVGIRGEGPSGFIEFLDHFRPFRNIAAQIFIEFLC